MMVRRAIQLEQLEKRLLLTVGVALNDAGDLVIDGDPDGAVLISGSAAGFNVTDNLIPVGDADLDVTGSIRITLGDGDDSVTIDLGEGSVHNVSANLGEGDNTLSISNGTVDGRFSYRGGDGDDGVTVEAAISRGIFARLGDGDNSLTIMDSVDDPVGDEEAASEVGGGVIVIGGDGSDTVTVEDGASVAHLVFARLGSGHNIVDIAGDLGSSLVVHGRGDVDDVIISGSVARNATASLGDGDNTVTLGDNGDGEVDTVGRNLTVRTGDGDDTVTIDAGASVGRNVKLRLGGGTNTVNHDGHIGGNLVIKTDNADDVDNIVTENGTVDGETIISLGEEEEHDHHSFFRRLFSHFRGRGRGRGDDGDGDGDGDGNGDDGGDGQHDGDRFSRFRDAFRRFRDRLGHRGGGA